MPSDRAEPHATGLRDLEGTGNNLANPNFGSANEPFIRLTDARYGEFNPDIGETGNRELNPIFDGLEPRDISNILGDQEDGLPTSEEGVNSLFTAFGQYFDHGLDFLPKGGSGTVFIDGEDVGRGQGTPNFADLTRGSVDSFDGDGIPQHLNQTSPFVDQNQAYGSNELVGIFLRESDGNGGAGARLLTGGADPSNPDFSLLPTLRELILHHWDNDTFFVDPATGLPGQTFREYFTDLPYAEDPDNPGEFLRATLVSETGEIHQELAEFLNSDFMGSGFILVGDANPFINILDHYVAGDLRANENVALTSIHTVWARNHNYHVDNLEKQGFDGTPEELFQAAKIINEAEYQRVVFDEFADALIGGIKGSGEHGFDDYNPDVDARISHEFAAAVYRVGHSLISDTVRILDGSGNVQDVPLVDVFLNPTNDNDAFTGPLPPGYVPQPGFEQLGVNGIIDGNVGQPAEEVDFNIVDAVRNDLVRVRADLFAFNVARGRDVGLGTLNQVRADLLASDDPYVKEAVDRSGEDLSPYKSWQDFQVRNGLSAAVIAQFIAAYPDLTLAADEIAAFQEINPGIEITINSDGTGTVKGIDRVDLWVGGLAEEHINGGVVGATFWVVLHEQLDRLQEGDRFYYLDRVDGFDFYDQVEEQTFADIIARNTGIEGLPSDVFFSDADEDQDNDDDQQDGDQQDDGDDDQQGDDGNDGDGDQSGGTDNPTPPTDGTPASTPLILVGDENDNSLVGADHDDTLVGDKGNDTLIANDGDNELAGGDGNDDLISGDGDDIILGGKGNDLVISGAGDDTIFTNGGKDHVIAGAGDDFVNSGAGRDVVDLGSGNDTYFASVNDGNDVVTGGEGIDTLDYSALTDGTRIDLGGATYGEVSGSQSGNDQVSGFENAVGGFGDDTLVANEVANLLTGGLGNDTFEFGSIAAANNDHVTDFSVGDQIDLRGISSSLGLQNGFDLLDTPTFTGEAGQLIVRSTDEGLFVEGDATGDQQADFSIKVTGVSELEEKDFIS